MVLVHVAATGDVCLLAVPRRQVGARLRLWPVVSLRVAKSCDCVSIRSAAGVAKVMWDAHDGAEDALPVLGRLDMVKRFCECPLWYGAMAVVLWSKVRLWIDKADDCIHKRAKAAW